MTNEAITALIISAALLLTFAFILISARICYGKVFERRVRAYDPYRGLDAPKYAPHADTIKRLIDGISAEKYELVSIKAKDGTLLRARYYHRRDGAPIHLICHGYKSPALRDGAGGSCDSRDMGHNLLLIYQRAHGESEGKTISFGILERYDVIAWAQYLTERFGKDTEIILIGTSMGAATVIMAAGLGLPDTVRCVIADCPYSSPKEIILSSARNMGFSPRLIYPFIALGARLFGGFSVNGASATEAARSLKIPLLLVHGEADSTVPYEMSVRIAEAAMAAGADCTLALFPAAEHCLPFITDHPRYEKIRNEFLAKHLIGERGGTDAR